LDKRYLKQAGEHDRYWQPGCDLALEVNKKSATAGDTCRALIDKLLTRFDHRLEHSKVLLKKPFQGDAWNDFVANRKGKGSWIAGVTWWSGQVVIQH
jgi:hypothetical protein